jgi:nitroreductase
MNDAFATLRSMIRSRRVTREYSAEPVTISEIRTILEAARWALAAGNARFLHYLVVQDPTTIGLLGKVSPGMSERPAALIVICVDTARARELNIQVERDSSILMDVGAAMMNMALTIHALGLGCCPVTSFSHSGLRTLLDLPQSMSPEVILQVGHRDPNAPKRTRRPGAPTRYTVDDMASWERLGVRLPE